MPISISQVLSVILALAVIYYVLGLIVSAMTKYVLETFNTRGKNLESFLKKNLIGIVQEGKTVTLEQLKAMPQLNSLKPVRYAKAGIGFFIGETKIVDVIERVPPKNLVDALFDLAGTFENGNEKVKAVIGLLPDKLPGVNGPVEFEAKKQLFNLANQGYEEVDDLRLKMETWFGGLMDQAAQDFKAQARRFVVLFSLIVTLVLGVDSIELAQKYWGSATLTATADAQASLILKLTDAQNQNTKADALIKQLDEMKAIDYKWYVMPVNPPNNWLLMKILGLLITMLAVSQGSSFWYDIIKQMKGEPPTTSTSTTTTTTQDPGSINLWRRAK